MEHFKRLISGEQSIDEYRVTFQRKKVQGEFNRLSIHEGYRNNKWLQSRVELADIFDVIATIEDRTSKFFISRLMMYFIICCFCSVFLFIGIGIQTNVDFRGEGSKVIYNFWNLSWPFFTALVFLPLIIFILYLINRCVLRKYQETIAIYFNDQNESRYKVRNLYWKVGNLCDNIQIAIIDKFTMDVESSQDGARAGINKQFLNVSNCQQASFKNQKQILNQIM